MDKNLEIKYENLKNFLKSLNSAAVAFSSGVDSTFLLSVAREILKDNLIAFIVNLNSFSKRELEEAVKFCIENNIKYEIIELDEINEVEGFKNNPNNRCYLCKKEIFKRIKNNALKYNISNILEGSNKDDDKDYRPGMKAIKELNILSPLKKAQLTKQEIRILSKQRNLKTYNKPSFACLASRFPYGEEITKEKIKMVENAENLLCSLGFYQYRVRIENKNARIEIEENEFEKIIQKEIRLKILEEFKKIGFNYVSLDLKGYRTGSLNEVLDGKQI